MKIVNAFAINNIKAALTKVAMAGFIAGAAFMATPAKANAQVAFGVRVGHVGIGYAAPRPIYVAPEPVYAPPVYGPNVYAAPVYGYYARGYYDRRDYGRRFDDRRWEHRDRRFER